MTNVGRNIAIALIGVGALSVGIFGLVASTYRSGEKDQFTITLHDGGGQGATVPGTNEKLSGSISASTSITTQGEDIVLDGKPTTQISTTGYHPYGDFDCNNLPVENKVDMNNATASADNGAYWKFTFYIANKLEKSYIDINQFLAVTANSKASKTNKDGEVEYFDICSVLRVRTYASLVTVDEEGHFSLNHQNRHTYAMEHSAKLKYYNPENGMYLTEEEYQARSTPAGYIDYATYTDPDKPVGGELSAGRELISDFNNSQYYGTEVPKKEFNYGFAEKFVSATSLVEDTPYRELAPGEVMRYTMLLWIEATDPDTMNFSLADAQNAGLSLELEVSASASANQHLE